MSNLRSQKKLASKVLGIGKSRVKVDGAMAEDIKEAITRADIRDLIAQGAIKVIPKSGVSRHRARERHLQRKRGRQRGQGVRKGRMGARNPHKRAWINKIRSLRNELKELREGEYITERTYKELYKKAKGNFFRDRGHALIYIKQRGLMKKSIEEREEKKKRRRYRRVKK